MTANNDYIQQVMAEQAEVEANLKRRKVAGLARAHADDGTDWARTGGTANDAPAVEVRETGWWRFKNVIVPPNAYAVHTRRGQTKPLHCGMGVSFKFNPQTDSYLVVPAAMQTVIINANCICSEKQGILVQGYVQWVIDDFWTAYRRLDFSDVADPMRVVNTQLREQAEAVIKDTVATMNLANVLSDRQPIIEELTSRLRTIMEGGNDDEGLGLRIVTVQIKEAVVSSANLWETLQRGYRAERTKEARLAELAQKAIIRDREAQERRAAELLAIDTAAQIAARKAEQEAAEFDQRQAEAARRAQVEAARLEEALKWEKAKAEKQAELDQLTIANQLAADKLRFDARNEEALTDIETAAAARRVDNDMSPELLKLKLIEMLPEIASNMPTPDEMKSVSINGVDGLSGLVPAVMALVERVGPAKLSNGN